jgi:hypothetical protein
MLLAACWSWLRDLTFISGHRLLLDKPDPAAPADSGAVVGEWNLSVFNLQPERIVK